MISYNKALEIEPSLPIAFAYKGLALGELGKINDALICFKKALSLDKDYDLALISQDTAIDILKSKN